MLIKYAYNATSYEWDPEKAKENITNHGISFETAILVFDNEITYDEPQIVDGEERLKTVAPVYGFMLTVINTERNNTIRIISAWSSTAEEIRLSDQERKKQGSVKNRKRRSRNNRKGGHCD